MTNGEKYLKDGVSEYDFLNFVFNEGNIGWNGEEDYCYIKKLDLLHLLQQPLKPTITEDEKVILRKILKELKYIGRRGDEKHSFLYVCEKPRQPQDYYALMFEDVFDFIKPRRRI